jgi:hypothetical protein
MASNPLIDQGTINRIRASVVFASFSNLNVTAPFLHKEGVSLALDGESTTYLPTMTGAATSPEPYMMVTCTIGLLKTQSLSAQFKAQMERLSTIGAYTVYPDVSAGLPTYQIQNGSISSVREMKFNGEDVGWWVLLRGYYIINNDLFGL